MSKGTTAGKNNEPEQKCHHQKKWQEFSTEIENCRHGNKKLEKNGKRWF